MLTPKQRLDASIAEVEEKLAKLKAVRNALDDEQIRIELSVIFGNSGNGKAKKPRKRGGGTVYEKIRQLFVSHNNAWMTLADIEKSGIKKPSARTILYTANKDEFDRESKQGGQRQTKFRLKNT